MSATHLGCSPGMPFYNPDRGSLGAEPSPMTLDPECKPCGGCGSCGGTEAGRGTRIED